MHLFMMGLLKKQAMLDHFIIEKKGISLEISNHSIYNNTLLACLVEIGELANEWQGFKHWKTDRTPKAGMGEEYADVLHFLLSLGNQIDARDFDFTGLNPRVVKLDSITLQFVEVYNHVLSLDKESLSEHDDAKIECIYRTVLEMFFGLGIMLGYDLEGIQNMYIDKWFKNIKRQVEGY